MKEVERVLFDFSGEEISDAVGRLEHILCSRHWSDRGLPCEDDWAELLLRLLTIGGISVYKRYYEPRLDASCEIRNRAGLYQSLMRKRGTSQALLDIAGIFGKYDFDGKKTIYNALFFPELSAYVRYGGLTTERLFELFSQDDCDMVIIFQDLYQGGEAAFYAFTRPMPRELFMDEIAQLRQRRISVLDEAARKIAKPYDGVFPHVPVLPKEADTK